MAWIRLDDQIAHHPKFLKAGPTASWLWVNCLGFAQKFLTNGFIPAESLPTLGTVDDPKQQAEKLVKVGLLDKVSGGYQIHDYLDFNEHSDEVKKRRKSDRDRKRNPVGIQSDSARIPDASRARVPSHPIPSVADPKSSDPYNKLVTTDVASLKANGNGSNGTNMRSRHPIFQGQRFVIFDWMFEDLTRMLGTHTDGFDLHEWFFTLDAAAAKSNQVIPKKDFPKWLEAQTLSEAKRRGLPIAVTDITAHISKSTERLLNAVDTIKREEAAKRK